MNNYRPSIYYNYVRSRQLEGTYDNDPKIGRWSITYLRILKGWGSPSEDDWPQDTSKWPPQEPANIDKIANKRMLLAYQRIRSVSDCRIALAKGWGVGVSVGITPAWGNATKGKILLPSANEQIIGWHSFSLAGYNDNTEEFIFTNSWGKEWGDDGYGYLPYEYFSQYMTDAWTEFPFFEKLEPRGDIIKEKRIGPTGNNVHVLEIRDICTGARRAWSIAVEYDNYLNVEDFFIHPKNHLKKDDCLLFRLLTDLSRSSSLPLRFWIPYIDVKLKYPIINLLKGNNFVILKSNVKWAKYQAVKRNLTSSYHIRDVIPNNELFDTTGDPLPPASCRSSSSESVTMEKVPDYKQVSVFFATDRNLTGESDPGKMFGSARSTGSAITYGTCDVSIPHDHRMGELESHSIWRLKFREDKEKHVVLLNVAVSTKDSFFADIAGRIHNSAKNSAFLFIHGYNVTFENAARRTAQMTYDLKFDGAPIFYSWPSRGKFLPYMHDEVNIEWTKANLTNFLEDFFTRSDVKNVYLIAHSMGNRGLTGAINLLLTKRPELRNRLTEVILTAPDIDAEIFMRDIVPGLTETGSPPVTLYASSKDLALVMSRLMHGNPRAGDSGQGLIVVPGIETIDATGMDTSFMGHSYFAESRSVLGDIFSLIENGTRPDQRLGLHRIDTLVGQYWKFNQGGVNSPSLAANLRNTILAVAAGVQVRT